MTTIKHSELASAAAAGLVPRVRNGRAEVPAAIPANVKLTSEQSIKGELTAAKGRLDKVEKGVKP